MADTSTATTTTATPAVARTHSNGTTQTAPASVPPKVQFIQYHRPGLQDGEYQLDIQETIQSTNSQIPQQAPYTTSLAFAVFGERFTLNPSEIQSVFPPASSLGDHSNVLPHVALRRSTLPWERSAIEERQDLPWLVVLLFDESEKPTPQTMTLSDLQQSPKARFPALKLEAAQHPDDPVTVIDVPKNLLQKMMPSTDELALMAHVRQGADEHDQPVGAEFAVIFGNRLPKPGSQSTAHLVSVENRYTPSGFSFPSGNTVRLVTLKSWAFTCSDPQECFEGLMENLDRTPNTLRLPPHRNADIEAYFAQGFVPLPRLTQHGDQTVSWYRSPLMTSASTERMPLPARSSADLVKTNPYNDLVDVSYAAAWELGRLLTLQSKQVSVEVFHWKRRHAHQIKQIEQQPTHLPIRPKRNDASAHPGSDIVTNWFRDLNVLKGVPFNYLVPDERMLPVESMRFFQIDQAWIECLLDGAFSIGRVMASDHQLDHTLSSNKPASQGLMSGFLMRSDVVAGWPSLVVDGDTPGGTVSPLRMDRLSSHVLLCLFAGTPATINIHLKPESMHFGVEEVDSNTYQKRIRDADGNLGNAPIAIPWKSSDVRVLNLASLANSLDADTSAKFALEMIEGVPKVRFAVAT